MLRSFHTEKKPEDRVLHSNARFGFKYLQTKNILQPNHFHHEDGGSKVLRNVGILSQHYMASQFEDGGS
jgi:hypothetical protein